jgi:DNA polymerase-3 subunit gamma/tau
MTEELYKKHRPTSFKQVVGQDHAVAALVDLGKRNAIPHCILFTGPSGVGKTTLARILRNKLKCGDADYREINASDQRGIDMVRDVRANMNLAPMSGKTRVWVVDEAHQLTSDAQNSFLKILEDTPSHVYFMLSTTDPQKLKKTIVTRSHEVRLKSIPNKDIVDVIERVTGEEGIDSLTDDVMDKLLSAADGSARKALVILHAIIGLESEEQQLKTIAESDYQEQAITIARLLLKPSRSWKEIAEVLKGVNEDAEQLRYMVLGYCRKILLGGGKMASRAANIIDRFQDNLYDSKLAGFALACYDVVKGDE